MIPCRNRRQINNILQMTPLSLSAGNWQAVIRICLRKRMRQSWFSRAFCFRVTSPYARRTEEQDARYDCHTTINNEF